MPTLRREFVAGLVTFAASAAIAACRGPYSRGGTQPSASAPPSNQQEAGGMSLPSRQLTRPYDGMSRRTPFIQATLLRITQPLNQETFNCRTLISMG